MKASFPTRCPHCGAVEGQIMHYGRRTCTKCAREYWMPKEVFLTQRYVDRTSDGFPILQVYFSPWIGYCVLSQNNSGQFVWGHVYDSAIGRWGNGYYHDTLEQVMREIEGELVLDNASLGDLSRTRR